MVDNSLDAIKRKSAIIQSIDDYIQVLIVLIDSKNLVQITVTDSGCGIKDPIEALCCFNTSKNSREQITGKYGIGKFDCSGIR